jgi:DNA-binding transcriptional LysR family regulator
LLDEATIDVAALRAYVRVVQHGSFTRAAESLGQRKSQVSRSVSALEAALGVKLLERTTRSLSLTEFGRDLHQRALAILAAIEDAALAAQAIQAEPQGLLRLTCGVEFGLLAVSGWVAEYLAAWPRTRVDVEYTARVVDLVHEGYDLAIRIGELDDSGLAARRLGELCYGLYASPAYLAAQGAPTDPADLARHAQLAFAGGRHGAAWTLGRAGETRRIGLNARLRVNNAWAVREAVQAGLGIGRLPRLIATAGVARGELAAVLPDWDAGRVPVWAVFPGHRWMTPKLRAFIDLAIARFPAETVAA